MSSNEEFRAALELGCDHTRYGRHALGRLSDRTAWAISVGADRASPALKSKGDARNPNEDALLAAEAGERVLLAVADAHFGRESSHDLLTFLSHRLPPVPEGPEELAGVVRQLAQREPAPRYASETSLLVVVYDRARRAGFGLSFGDSTFAIVGATGHRRPIVRRASTFVSPASPGSVNPDLADGFSFEAAPGDLLLAYTDGIDECHYGKPESSVTPAVMADLWRDVGSDPGDYLQRLVELALAGVGGQPGGQDNLAVVAAKA